MQQKLLACRSLAEEADIGHTEATDLRTAAQVDLAVDAAAILSGPPQWQVAQAAQMARTALQGKALAGLGKVLQPVHSGKLPVNSMQVEVVAGHPIIQMVMVIRTMRMVRRAAQAVAAQAVHTILLANRGRPAMAEVAEVVEITPAIQTAQQEVLVSSSYASRPHNNRRSVLSRRSPCSERTDQICQQSSETQSIQTQEEAGDCPPSPILPIQAIGSGMTRITQFWPF